MYKQISVHMVSAKMLVLSIYLTLKIPLNCIKPGLVFLANSTFRFLSVTPIKCSIGILRDFSDLAL